MLTAQLRNWGLPLDAAQRIVAELAANVPGGRPVRRTTLERMVAARMARKSVFERSPAPELSFVQEEVTLRRPIGDAMVLRRQLEHMLEVARLPFVELQMMPTVRATIPGRVV